MSGWPKQILAGVIALGALSLALFLPAGTAQATTTIINSGQTFYANGNANYGSVTFTANQGDTKYLEGKLFVGDAWVNGSGLRLMVSVGLKCSDDPTEYLTLGTRNIKQGQADFWMMARALWTAETTGTFTCSLVGNPTIAGGSTSNSYYYMTTPGSYIKVDAENSLAKQAYQPSPDQTYEPNDAFDANVLSWTAPTDSAGAIIPTAFTASSDLQLTNCYDTQTNGTNCRTSPTNTKAATVETRFSVFQKWPAGSTNPGYCAKTYYPSSASPPQTSTISRDTHHYRISNTVAVTIVPTCSPEFRIKVYGEVLTGNPVSIQGSGNNYSVSIVRSVS